MKKPKGTPRLPTKAQWKAAFSARSFRVGGYSVAAALLVVVIAVAANLLVQALPASVTQWDTSNGEMFTISQETETILAGLEEDVAVYWVVQSGQEDATLETLLERYAALSGHIKVEKKDPDLDPAFLEEYVSSGVYNNSLIVASDTRSTYVSYEDIYEYDYGEDYSSYSASFNGESALTSAIDYVGKQTLPKLYTLTGHGEKELSASFQGAVEKQNVEIQELSLLTTDTVPEDADCLLIYGPTGDISQAEKETILTYLDQGGDLILLSDPTQDGSSRPNLEALLAEYGMAPAQGIVVEGDASCYALGNPLYLLPEIQSHTVTDPLMEGGYYILLTLAQGITTDAGDREDLAVEPLLQTSSAAYAKAAGYQMETYEQEEGDAQGPFALAAAAEKTLADGGESHVIWVGATSLLEEELDQQVSGANQDLFLNCVDLTCQGEEGVSIHAKAISTDYLTLSTGTVWVLTFLVVALVPLGYLAFGLQIWIRRKRQ